MKLHQCIISESLIYIDDVYIHLIRKRSLAVIVNTMHDHNELWVYVEAV